MPLRVAIIGGGAAGLMGAATLLEEYPSAKIHLFEKNKQLGTKVIISGGGRCNVTTGIRDKKELFSKYTRGSHFLRTAIGQFPPEKVVEWFEAHGVPLKTEPDNRIFPVSNKGQDVVGVFEKLFKQHGVSLHFSEPVISISQKGPLSAELITTKKTYEFDAIVLCTGGNAYRHTGSTGDGYDFAQSFGHSITPLGPSLNSFLCAEEWVKSLSGLSLSHAELRAQTDDGTQVSAQGPMLFTHFGVSGPSVFALSSHLAFTTLSPEKPVHIAMLPIAGRSAHEWNEIIHSEMKQNGAQQIITLLKNHLPHRLAQTILEITSIPAEKKNSEISREEREKLLLILTGKLTISLTKRRPGDEFVTAGGVKLSEVDSKTMRSKLHPSLYFAGEVLDIDGVTGGFNLQASWATGRLAGKSIAHDKRKKTQDRID
ncbi:MAG: NAD(P)/FAD-dependent oxidoreductase [bacterium]|nr:NAD(P)/FAD-dependent oxidoreductase [bacterium]